MELQEHEYHSLTVAAVVDETADTRSFVLDIPPALDDAFAYTAGQFCTFRATIAGLSWGHSITTSTTISAPRINNGTRVRCPYTISCARHCVIPRRFYGHFSALSMIEKRNTMNGICHGLLL